jgi:hypothetical protein
MKDEDDDRRAWLLAARDGQRALTAIIFLSVSDLTPSSLNTAKDSHAAKQLDSAWDGVL